MSETIIALIVTVVLLAAMAAFVPCQMHLEKRCAGWRARRQTKAPELKLVEPQQTTPIRRHA